MGSKFGSGLDSSVMPQTPFAAAHFVGFSQPRPYQAVPSWCVCLTVTL